MLSDPFEYRIRRAGPDDAHVISGLIRELAEYERLAHEANPDPDDLRQHLGDDARPRCEAFVAESATTSIGFALYFPKYSTFLTGWSLHLEDLYVRPEYRRRGVGAALLKAVASEAVERSCGRLELNVLDWNRGAIDFYVGLGGITLDDWNTMRFTGAALKRLAQAQPEG